MIDKAVRAVLINTNHTIQMPHVSICHKISLDMLNKFVLVELYDILIFSPIEETHKQHVHQGLQCPLDHQLFMKVEFEFHVSSV